ncbi:clavesin-2 [Folsomia candida]|uniref:clavesin-2 n=1 Tax=Folsomia candida TaxID=158441 RepID=UPI000B8EF47D|nr:clavesin-2 [Folsomia candida]
MESDTKLEQSLSELKLKIKEHDKLGPYSEILDDPFLNAFLQGKGFDVDVALSYVEKYMHMRTVKYKKQLSPYLPSKTRLLETELGQMLRNKDQHGRYIAVLNTYVWNPETTSVQEGIATLLFALDEGMRRYFSHKPDGVVLIVDCKDPTFAKIRAGTLPVLIEVVDLIFKCLPASPKEIHFVNENILYRATLNIFMTLFGRKIRGRVHIHSSNMESLHKFVAPNILPKSLGGTLTNEEAYDSDLINGARENDKFYKGIWPSDEL